MADRYRAGSTEFDQVMPSLEAARPRRRPIELVINIVISGMWAMIG